MQPGQLAEDQLEVLPAYALHLAGRDHPRVVVRGLLVADPGGHPRGEGVDVLEERSAEGLCRTAGSDVAHASW